LKLCELAPERVIAAVLEQPVGIIASNRELFDNLWKQWGEQLKSKRLDLGSDEIEAVSRFLRDHTPRQNTSEWCPAR
jgi:hypothetical protein